MINIPVLSGREIIRALGALGYRIARKRGSHFRLACPGRKPITTPDYRAVSKGLLRKILRDALLSIDEFMRLLEP